MSYSLPLQPFLGGFLSWYTLQILDIQMFILHFLEIYLVKSNKNYSYLISLINLLDIGQSSKVDLMISC